MAARLPHSTHGCRAAAAVNRESGWPRAAAGRAGVRVRPSNQQYPPGGKLTPTPRTPGSALLPPSTFGKQGVGCVPPWTAS
jgi:hypothetical protein